MLNIQDWEKGLWTASMTEAQITGRKRSGRRERLAARDAELRERRNRAQLEAQLAVQDERENAIALSLILLLIAVAAGYMAEQARLKEGGERRMAVAILIAVAALAGSI